MESSLIALALVIVVIGTILLIYIGGKSTKLNKPYFQKQLQKIQAEKNSLAIMVGADNLLDEAMRKRNIRGQTMGERLNNSEAFIKDVNAAWKAHKLRNRMVHESGTQVSDKEIKHHLNVYKKALKDLGAI